VAELAVMIGDKIGVSSEELDLLNFSGHLHDIGKIGIRDNILLKPGQLTREEYTVIKAHPIIGANIIGHLGLMSEEQRIVRYHHERWDGKGYPDGLSGEKIPFLSRILAVADTYDAMASDRAYRKKIERDVIIETIEQNAGKQFDPQVVKAFLSAQEGGKMTSKGGLSTLSHKKPRVVNLESNPFEGRPINM
jgi:HD-GYP domain-containing protein (c-di-GMP phosphodiesterase class II)